MRKLFYLIAISVSIMFGGIVISEVYGEQKVPVPEFYGIYIVSDGKLITPKDAVKEKRLKTVGHLMSSSFGIKGGANKMLSTVIIPNTEDRLKIMGSIVLDNSVNAQPCDCTACGSCRCTPCK